MINVPTLFILGAGASADYGFPTGEQLWRILAGQQVLSPLWISGSESRFGTEYEQKQLSYFQSELKKSQLSPVDRFAEMMDKRNSPNSKELIRFWRLAVAQVILTSESRHAHSFENVSYNEKLVLDPVEPNARTISATPWFSELFTKMARGITDPEEFFSANKVQFWTFNYDRLLEQMFFYSIRATFELSDEKADAIVKSAKIWHIHGTFGEFYGCDQSTLDSINIAALRNRVPYGFLNGRAIKIAADGIHFAHEPVDEERRESLWEEWFKMAVRNGEKQGIIAFLGFGFDQNNLTKMDLLAGAKLEACVKGVYASLRGSQFPQVEEYLNTIGLGLRNRREGIRELLQIIPN